MEKSFVGFGPGSSALPVRSQDGVQSLIRRGRGRAALRQLYGLAAGLAAGWAVLYGQLYPFGLGLVLGLGEDCFAACGAGAVLALLLRGAGGAHRLPDLRHWGRGGGPVAVAPEVSAGGPGRVRPAAGQRLLLQSLHRRGRAAVFGGGPRCWPPAWGTCSAARPPKRKELGGWCWSCAGRRPWAASGQGRSVWGWPPPWPIRWRWPAGANCSPLSAGRLRPRPGCAAPTLPWPAAG